MFSRYPNVECALCGYLFCNKRSLINHLDSRHSGSNTGFKKKVHRKCNDLQCLEKGCNCKFYNKELFISHLKYDHCIDFDVRRLKFNSEDGKTLYYVYLISIYNFCLWIRIYLFN